MTELTPEREAELRKAIESHNSRHDECSTNQPCDCRCCRTNRLALECLNAARSRVAEVEKERDDLANRLRGSLAVNRNLIESVKSLESRLADAEGVVEVLDQTLDSIRDFLLLLPPNIFDSIFVDRPIPGIVKKINEAIARAAARREGKVNHAD